MASTYTTNLRLELQGLGENRASWGARANNVFTLADVAIAGLTAVSMPDANYTLTALNGAVDQARNMFLRFTGALTADRTVTVPSVSKLYIVHNATTGGKNIILTTGTGANSTLVNGMWKFVFTDGSDVWTNEKFVTFSTTTQRWGITVVVDAAGMIEVGRYVDFHNTNADVADYSVRLETGNTTGDLYIVPSVGPQAGVGGKIWNANNDGQLSGMDADLLDGFHASEIRFIEPPNDGKTYARKMSGGVGSWVEVVQTWTIDTNNDIILKFAGVTVVRIRSDGFIRTKSDVQIYSTTV